MTTVVADVVEDYKVVANTTSYSSPNQQFFLDTPQVQSGLLNSVWSVSPRICSRDDTNVYGDVKAALVEKNSPSTAGGECGPALLDASGNGYELKIVYTETRIHVVNAGVRGIALGGQVNITSAAGDVFGLAINAAGEMIATQNGVDLGHTVTDTTYPASTLTPGQFSDRNSSGGGFQSGVLSWGGSGVEASGPEISSINEGSGIESGSTGNTMTVSGFVSPVTALTVGGLTMTAVTNTSGDNYTFTDPGFIDGEVDPGFGTLSAVASNTGETSAGFNVTRTLGADLTAVVLSTLSEDPETIVVKSAAQGLTVASTDTLYHGTGLTIYDDGTISDADDGDHEVWHRDESTNFMTLIIVTIGAGVVIGVGITMRALTASALTMRSLTMRSL